MESTIRVYSDLFPGYYTNSEGDLVKEATGFKRRVTITRKKEGISDTYAGGKGGYLFTVEGKSKWITRQKLIDIFQHEIKKQFAHILNENLLTDPLSTMSVSVKKGEYADLD